jgi:hypothetical protein
MDQRLAEARSVALRMTTFVAEGLKLKVPVDIPIEPYIELLHDYRPQFTSLTKELLNGASQGGECSVGL